MRNYINGFSQNAREILEKFDFDKQIDKLEEADILYMTVERFAEIDLHPDKVSNQEMGHIYEELIRRFSEESNETAGHHFTPREVIRLMVNILFAEDRDFLRKKGIVRTLYDPAAGTGGMLSIAEEYLRELNDDARLIVFGQELNPETYAICKSDMMLKGQNAENIKYGNSFSVDGFPDKKFDYMLSNPPYGVDWKKVENFVKREHEVLKENGRFGAGLPRINDGSLLFLQHMISKMKPRKDGGSRLAIVFNSSPLFTGDAGSGESNIRKWIIENDLLEAIIALPDQLFYNTGIFTYVWVVSNNKPDERKDKIQLINAVLFYEKLYPNLGQKRHYITDDQIKEITRLYHEFKPNKHCLIFDKKYFGYTRITIERPLRRNFQLSESRLARLRKYGKQNPKSKKSKNDNAFIESLIEVLGSSDQTQIYKNYNQFIDLARTLIENAGLKFTQQVRKMLENALAERDETAEPAMDEDDHLIPDPELRDYENVPLEEDIEQYFKREVKPFLPDSWIDDTTRSNIGYEIPFAMHFYKYEPSRSLHEIDTNLKELEGQIVGGLKELLED